MKIKYLGTAAAEAIPALFCQCEICQNARIKKGKEIRGRTSVYVDDVMIDFSPDAFWNSVRYELDYTKLHHLILTHSHLDHFDAGELVMRNPKMYSSNLEGDLHIYGNATCKEVFEKISALDNNNQPIEGMYFHEVDYTKTFQCKHLKVTPLWADHKKDEKAMIYLIQSDARSMLYAHDTGELDERVYTYLKEYHIILDFVSLDCTCGKHDVSKGHMGFSSVLKVKEKLKPFTTDNTIFVISHFSHYGSLSHEQLEQLAKPHGIHVAYDGLTIEV